ncbi:MAG TPA: hypothetical protein VMC85_11350 [Desulfomonilaceae bacterium]|nr:hypothetical protein [Desulfomonilaceae bacterium]
MPGREKKPTVDTDAGFASAEPEEQLPASTEGDESQHYVIASAKSIPRPGTAMASPPKGSIGKVSVSLLGDLDSAPVLEEVQKINKEAREDARTPLMTVIHAILAKHGGTMPLEDLAGQVVKYWNRTFPPSPYSNEEFVYIMMRNSDSVRISE